MEIYKAPDILLKLQQRLYKHILKPLDKIISKFFLIIEKYIKFYPNSDSWFTRDNWILPKMMIK